MAFGAAPVVLDGFIYGEMEEMSALDLRPQGADVVTGSAEFADQDQPVQAGFFSGFSKDGLFGRLSLSHGTARDLDPGLFGRLVERAYDKEPVTVEDVGQRFVHHGLAPHCVAFAGGLTGRAYADAPRPVVCAR